MKLFSVSQMYNRLKTCANLSKDQQMLRLRMIQAELERANQIYQIKKTDNPKVIIDGIDEQFDAKETLLHIASRRGYLQITRVLLEFGASQLMRDEDNYLPLHWAIEKGYSEVADFLMQDPSFKAVGLNAFDFYKKEKKKQRRIPLLHFAVKWGDERLVRFLCDNYPAEINVLNGLKQTALYPAIFLMRMEKCKILLEKGILLDGTDISGKTLDEEIEGCKDSGFKEKIKELVNEYRNKRQQSKLEVSATDQTKIYEGPSQTKAEEKEEGEITEMEISSPEKESEKKRKAKFALKDDSSSEENSDSDDDLPYREETPPVKTRKLQVTKERVQVDTFTEEDLLKQITAERELQKELQNKITKVQNFTESLQPKIVKAQQELAKYQESLHQVQDLVSKNKELTQSLIQQSVGRSAKRFLESFPKGSAELAGYQREKMHKAGSKSGSSQNVETPQHGFK